MNWDTGDPAFMGAVMLATIGLLVIAIAMDMRKLPLGQVKYVPWTMLTLILMFGVIFEAKLLLQDLAG